jgi:hypothetical protein
MSIDEIEQMQMEQGDKDCFAGLLVVEHDDGSCTPYLAQIWADSKAEAIGKLVLDLEDRIESTDRIINVRVLELHMGMEVEDALARLTDLTIEHEALIAEHHSLKEKYEKAFKNSTVAALDFDDVKLLLKEAENNYELEREERRAFKDALDLTERALELERENNAELQEKVRMYEEIAEDIPHIPAEEVIGHLEAVYQWDNGIRSSEVTPENVDAKLGLSAVKVEKKTKREVTVPGTGGGSALIEGYQDGWPEEDKDILELKGNKAQKRILELTVCLRLAVGWLDILRDRMEATHRKYPDEHKLSLSDIPEWINNLSGHLRKEEPSMPILKELKKDNKDLPPEVRPDHTLARKCAYIAKQLDAVKDSLEDLKYGAKIRRKVKNAKTVAEWIKAYGRALDIPDETLD